MDNEMHHNGSTKLTNGSTASGSALSDDWPTLAVLGRRYIDKVLAFTGNNKTRAAEVLGIDRRTLNRMFARERAKKQAAQAAAAAMGGRSKDE